MHRGGVAASIVIATALLTKGAAATDPWDDPDPRGEPIRHEFGDYGAEFDAEYRAVGLYVNPIDLSGVKSRRASWFEHRLRLGVAVDYDEKVRFVLSMDALDGTLWGDNGTFGGDPATNSGIRVSASNPNSTRPVVGFVGGNDALDPDNYGYILRENNPILIRRAYGEVLTPVGLLRIGRQPATEGTGLVLADGDGNRNRWGYANRGDSIDRILFATKPLEGLKPKDERDRSRERGVFLATFYDHVAQADPRLFEDDMQGVGTAIRWLAPDPARKRRLALLAAYAHRWETTNDTNVNAVNVRMSASLDRLGIGVEGVALLGATREVSEALALINSDPVVRQSIEQFGARAVMRWDEPKWTAYFEVDFASGDRNPNPGSDLTQFIWAEDTNVGLLMFKRILGYESARSAASGVELLRRVGATTFPAQRLDTEGSFTNALAVFPQFDFHLKENLLLRAGVLAAWAPTGLVDAIQTLRRRDGIEVEDDLINFHGGKPGNFYGVELDGRFQWKLYDHFIFDLEGAVLFPGDAFYDENEQAARSVLLQGRTTFVF